MMSHVRMEAGKINAIPAAIPSDVKVLLPRVEGLTTPPSPRRRVGTAMKWSSEATTSVTCSATRGSLASVEVDRVRISSGVSLLDGGAALWPAGSPVRLELTGA